MVAKKSTVAKPVVPETPAPVAVSPPAPSPVPAPQPPAPVPTTETDDFNTKFESAFEKVTQVANAAKELIVLLKTMQKAYAKSAKTTKKARKVSNEKRPPSGFAKPALLSDELCEFLKIEKGSLRARTEVTRMLNKYISENALQKQGDRRVIVPNAELKKLMNLADGQELTYFNLQTHIKHHFKKA